MSQENLFSKGVKNIGVLKYESWCHQKVMTHIFISRYTELDKLLKNVCQKINNSKRVFKNKNWMDWNILKVGLHLFLWYINTQLIHAIIRKVLKICNHKKSPTAQTLHIC